MIKTSRALAALGLAAGLAALPVLAPAASDKGSPVTPACDRACLEAFADRYMAALVVRDPARLPWAPRVRFSENNVMLRVGDGAWNTTTGKLNIDLKYADPETGEVGFVGVVEQHGAPGFYSMRLKVEDGKISEVETLINTPTPGAAASTFGADPKAYVHYPQMGAILPPDQRTPRLRMIDLANGYFSTLQLNDGKLFTTFADDCRRQENGFESAGNATSDRGNFHLNCGDQFKTGAFISDSAVRDRSYIIVDEARGLVLARAFIDHNAAADQYRMADGSMQPARAKTPNTLCMLELFHITAGKIDRIEVVHIGVPYAMPSVWRRDAE